VKPTSAGYATYHVEPNLGGLEWMQGKVPTPTGEIELYVSKEQIKMTGAAGTGTLQIKSKTKPTGKNISAVAKGADVYEIMIKPGTEYVIDYSVL